MLKKCFSSVFLLTLFFSKSFSQIDFYSPSSPLHFGSDELTVEKIAGKIRDHEDNYESILSNEDDMKKLMQVVEYNNYKVDSVLKYIEKELIKASSIKQDLLQLKDVEKISEHIDQLKKQRSEIENQIQIKLENIQYEGLYIVVLDEIPALISKETLAKIAETALTPQAINDLTAVFIESLSSANNNILEKDIISLVTSGEMSIAKQHYQSPMYDLRKYICLVSVRVTPLKKTVVGSDYKTPEKIKPYIIDLSKENYSQKLAELNIPENVISEMINSANINFLMNSIATSNENANANQKSILKIGNDNLIKNQADIDKVMYDLNNRNTAIRNAVVQLDLPFDEKNVQASLENAEKEINLFEKKCEQTYVYINEKTIIETIVQKVTPQDSPPDDIAKATIGLVKQLVQSYSKVEMFRNEFIVNQHVPVSSETNQKKFIYRKIDEIWLYLVPDQGDFRIKVLARFKIDSQSKENEYDSQQTGYNLYSDNKAYSFATPGNNSGIKKSVESYKDNSKSEKRWVRRILFGGMTTGFAILGYKQHQQAKSRLQTYQSMRIGTPENFDDAYNSYKKRINYRNLSCSAAALTGTLFIISIPF
ncbi:MAG TPA: hypothetical protein VHP36_01335 [Chitinispirillaceae bacterium]|nr:hypothetical protein [Chitinispirillaceae bacterium]